MPAPRFTRSLNLFRFLSSILALASLAFTLSAQAQTEKTIFTMTTAQRNTLSAGLISDNRGNLYGVSSGSSDIVYKLSRVGASWQQSVLYTFTGGADGKTPSSTLLMDSTGNLYGTTLYGGNISHAPCASLGCGVVYKLTPTASGPWQETVLYAFTGGKNGGYALSGNLVFGNSGELYGSNVAAGNVTTQACQNTSGCGVIFRLTPTTSGPWTYTVLHTFNGGKDGVGPALLSTNAGTLYGTVAGAWGGWEGPPQPGDAFKLTPTSSGPWKYTVILGFVSGPNGGLPGGLVFDKAGNAYGSTSEGGDMSECEAADTAFEGCGVVYKLSPTSGDWKQTILYTFTGGSDGSVPNGQLIFNHGSLYGTTQGGGLTGNGVIFKLTPVGNGQWQESVAHSFASTDGAWPLSPLAGSAAGNLFGLTFTGGDNGVGVVFELMP